VAGCELKPLRYLLDDADVCACQPQELNDRQADGACAKDEHAVARLHACAPDRMDADAQRLDQGHLHRRKLSALIELFRGQNHPFPHTAVFVDADHAHSRAAIGPPERAGRALAAGDIRVDGAEVAGLELASPIAGLEDLDRQLMPENSRIGEDGCVPSKAWRSVPQMPTISTLTSASPDPGAPGPAVWL
jgi:hypothetical protein